MSNGLRIMLVDDDKIDLFIHSELIKQIPHVSSVMQYGSGAAALKFLEENDATGWPDVILLDIHMPMMSGFGFLASYVKLPKALREKCRVIMLSSTLNSGDHEQVKINGEIRGFLEKPLNIANLVKLVES